jgi:TRAP-type C4-dicarboxylate transport system permease small subunit
VETARTVLRVLFYFMGAVATLFYAALALLLLADVIGRELFDQGIFGAQRAAVYCTIVAGNFGLALAAAAGAHIRPRIADKWTPAAWSASLDRLADLITGTVFVAVAFFATKLVQESFGFETVSPVIDWKIWPVQAVIPLGYLMAALHYFIFAAYPALRPQQAQVSE